MTGRTVYATDTCYECELQAAGRCPTCHHSLCVDHFPLDQHAPCSERLVAESANWVCYVCASPVAPRQWSTSSFTHYIDPQRCAGCRRVICADHTRLRDEIVKIDRESTRSNRYHITLRYCHLCAPLRRVGGLIGVTWWGVGWLSAAAAAVFLFHH